MNSHFSSSSLNQLFSIPSDDWTAINKRVGLVNASLGGKYYPYFYGFTNFEAVRQVCHKWERQTFPALTKTAQKIEQFAGVAIDQLEPLAALLIQLDVENRLIVPEEVHHLLGETVQAMHDALLPIANTVVSLYAEVKEFHDINEAADAGYKGRATPSWATITPAPRRVLQAIGHMQSEWLAIQDNLRYLAEREIAIDMPLIAQLAVAEDVANWRKLQQEAKGFIAHAERQGPFISGQYLYDESPIEENGWYVILLDPRSFRTDFAQFLSPDRTRPEASGWYWLRAARFQEVHEYAMWRFEPTEYGHGSYRIINQMFSDYALDLRPPYLVLDKRRPHGYVGQVWRILGGRLINPFYSGWVSLDSYKRVVLAEKNETFFTITRGAEYMRAFD